MRTPVHPELLLPSRDTVQAAAAATPTTSCHPRPTFTCQSRAIHLPDLQFRCRLRYRSPIQKEEEEERIQANDGGLRPYGGTGQNPSFRHGRRRSQDRQHTSLPRMSSQSTPVTTTTAATVEESTDREEEEEEREEERQHRRARSSSSSNSDRRSPPCLRVPTRLSVRQRPCPRRRSRQHRCHQSLRTRLRTLHRARRSLLPLLWLLLALDPNSNSSRTARRPTRRSSTCRDQSITILAVSAMRTSLNNCDETRVKVTRLGKEEEA